MSTRQNSFSYMGYPGLAMGSEISSFFRRQNPIFLHEISRIEDGKGNWEFSRRQIPFTSTEYPGLLMGREIRRFFWW